MKLRALVQSFVNDRLYEAGDEFEYTPHPDPEKRMFISSNLEGADDEAREHIASQPSKADISKLNASRTLAAQGDSEDPNNGGSVAELRDQTQPLG